MSEQEGKTNSQEKGQSNFRERLTVKAKELPEQVKAAIARAKTASPRNALLNLAGLTPEAKQRRLSAKEDQERQEQQQREAKALVAEIDQLFPESSKFYNSSERPYTKEEYNRYKNESIGYHSRVESTNSIRLAGKDQVSLTENKPSYSPPGKGDRHITLERNHKDENGDRRDIVNLRVMPDGKTIQFENSGRYSNTSGEGEPMPVAYAASYDKDPFMGKIFSDPASVLGLGKEIVGDVSKAEAAKVAQPQQAASVK